MLFFEQIKDPGSGLSRDPSLPLVSGPPALSGSLVDRDEDATPLTFKIADDVIRIEAGDTTRAVVFLNTDRPERIRVGWNTSVAPTVRGVILPAGRPTLDQAGALDGIWYAIIPARSAITLRAADDVVIKRMSVGNLLGVIQDWPESQGRLELDERTRKGETGLVHVRRNANARLQVDLRFRNHGNQVDADLMRTLSDLAEPFMVLPLDRGVARGSEWQQAEICRRIEVTRFQGFAGYAGIAGLGPSGSVRMNEATGARASVPIEPPPTVLFMGGRSTAGDFHSVGKSTGIAERIGGAVDFGVGETSIVSLTYDANTDTVYMVGVQLDAIFVVERTTGVAIRQVGAATSFGVGETLPRGIAFDPMTDTMYMIGNQTDALFTVDLDTGVATQVGSAVSFGVLETDPTQLALDPATGTLYMTSATAPHNLYSLNRTTGEATVIAPITGAGVPFGLAFDPSTGTLFSISAQALFTIDPVTGVGTQVDVAVSQFGIGQSSAFGMSPGLIPVPRPPVLYMVGRITDALYTVNLTDGQTVQVGSAIQFDAVLGDPQSLASDSETDTLWMVANNILWTVNRNTGVATRVGALTAFGITSPFINVRGLTYDRRRGVLYGVSLGGNIGRLITIDPVTSQGTLITDLENFGVGEATPQALANDADADILYMAGSGGDQIYILNRSTAEATTIGLPPQLGVGAANPIGLAFNPVNRNLYLLDFTLRRLITVDPETLTVTVGPGEVDFGVGETEPTGLTIF